MRNLVDRAMHARGFKRSRSGTISTSVLVNIPPELWLKIFSYLQSGPWDIKAVTLTCFLFRQLAQPLLFAKICTHPPPHSIALRATTDKYRRRTTKRLEFFLSPLIAPAVRECWVDPPSPEDDDLPTDVLIDAIFDGLRKLPNLKVLGCRSIRLTPKRLAVLQRLALTSITLESCLSDLTDYTTLPAVPLSHVTFKYHDAASQGAVLPPLLSLFLSARHLQRLSATSTDILPVILRSRPFKRLVMLEIPTECLVSPYFLPALAQFPALERITLHTLNPSGQFPRADVISNIPRNLMPNLRFYRGPRNYAALFASKRALKTVEISLPCKQHRLLRTLAQIKCELDYLSFRLEGAMSKTLLNSVLSQFPTLRKLSVNDPPVSGSELLALLSECAPHPALRIFRIRVEGRDKYNLWIPPMEEASDAVDCYKKGRAQIERVFPNLMSLKFLYGHEGEAIVWRRSSTTNKFIQAT